MLKPILFNTEMVQAILEGCKTQTRRVAFVADLCAKYLVKGRQCAIKGSIQYRSYNAQDGSKRYITEIVADKVKFLGGSRQQTGGQQATPDGYTQQGEFVQVDDDELPF